jgi:hypothetical protein
VAWDTREKALQKKSPDLWGQIDKAMDDFININHLIAELNRSRVH